MYKILENYIDSSQIDNKANLTEFHFIILQPSSEFSGCKIEYRPQILVCKPPKGL